jgi:dCMP deaminase
MIPDWDTYYMDIAEAVSRRSKDPNTKVGCVIVSQSNRQISQGYNSFPSGANDQVEERFVRPEKYLYIEHGERNAIYSAARHGIALVGSRIYTMNLPCMDCARAIIQAGIVEVIYDADRQDRWKTPQYEPIFDKSVALLRECRVDIRPWRRVGTM